LPLFAIPDYLHSTIRLNLPQQEVDIGIPAFRDVEELRLGEVLRMPFREQRPTWRLDGYGGPDWVSSNVADIDHRR
jgi:hypothetical protein